MPNHCENRLSVKANSPEAYPELFDFKQKTQVLDEDGEVQFTMSNIIPTPEELLVSPKEVYAYELRQKYGHDGWYSWRVANWGTKWDAYETIIEHDGDDEITLSYQTAWNPNLPFLLTVSRMYPNLTFTLTYIEPGMAFCGKSIISNGQHESNHGDIGYVDDNGNEVVYDEDLHKFKYKNGEVLHDQFYPNYVNPYA